MINQATRNKGTPVIVASVYDPLDQNKIIKDNLLVFIDSGALHSMAKASLVTKYKDSFFKRSKASYKMATGMFKSKHSMKLMFTLNEFGRVTKISHAFDLDGSKDSIG